MRAAETTTRLRHRLARRGRPPTRRERVARAVRPRAHRVRAAVEPVAERAKETLEPVAERTREALAAAPEVAGRAAETASRAAEEGRRTIERVLEEVDERVDEETLRRWGPRVLLLLTGFALGLVIGLLVGRRDRDEDDELAEQGLAQAPRTHGVGVPETGPRAVTSS